jgi:hypothetical protein
LKEKIKINVDCKMQNVDERTVPPIRLAAHILKMI